VQPGDWISFRCITKEQASEHLARLRRSGIASVAFVVAENADAFALVYDSLESNHATRTVELERTPGLGFGFGIVGPSDNDPIGMPLHRGVFIAELQPDSPACTLGLLEIGDRIVSVNGVDVLASTHSDAVQLIQGSPTKLTLVVVMEMNAYTRAEHTPKVPAASLRNHRTTRQSSRRKSSLRKVNVEFPNPPFHVRALFDYKAADTSELSFRQRDILRVIDISDPQFWIASHLSSTVTGKIPSRTKREVDWRQSSALTHVDGSNAGVCLNSHAYLPF
jgi:hypothetical protein